MTPRHNYYQDLLDLERLDPRSRSLWDGQPRAGLEAYVASRLLTAHRADVALELMRSWPTDVAVAQKIGAALRIKLSMFQGFSGLAKRDLQRRGPRDLAARELEMWSGQSTREVRSRMLVEVPVRADWNRRRVRYDDRDGVVNFYRRTHSYIWELMAANHLIETLFNYHVILDKLKNLRVTEFVDYGAGIGSFVIAGQRLGMKAIHMDLPSPSWNFAKWRYAHRNMAVRMMPATGQHDDLPAGLTIVCTEVIEHVPDPVRLLDAFQIAIPRGGYLVLSESCRYVEEFASHLPQNRWLAGGRMDYELVQRGFMEVPTEPPVHPKLYRRVSDAMPKGRPRHP